MSLKDLQPSIVSESVHQNIEFSLFFIFSDLKKKPHTELMQDKDRTEDIVDGSGTKRSSSEGMRYCTRSIYFTS